VGSTWAYTQFATWAAVDCLARRAVVRERDAGEAHRKSAGNGRESRGCRVKRKTLWGPQAGRNVGGVSRFLLPTFLCGGKEK